MLSEGRDCTETLPQVHILIGNLSYSNGKSGFGNAGVKVVLLQSSVPQCGETWTTQTKSGFYSPADLRCHLWKLTERYQLVLQEDQTLETQLRADKSEHCPGLFPSQKLSLGNQRCLLVSSDTKPPQGSRVAQIPLLSTGSISFPFLLHAEKHRLLQSRPLNTAVWLRSCFFTGSPPTAVNPCYGSTDPAL